MICAIRDEGDDVKEESPVINLLHADLWLLKLGRPPDKQNTKTGATESDSQIRLNRLVLYLQKTV